MFLPIPPGGTETPRTLTATEVLVKIAIPTFPLVSLIPAAVAIAVTEVIALPKVIALPEVITATVEPACVTAPRGIPVVTPSVAGAGAAPPLPGFAIVTPAAIVTAVAIPVTVPLTAEITIAVPETTAAPGAFVPIETPGARFGVACPA